MSFLVQILLQKAAGRAGASCLLKSGQQTSSGGLYMGLQLQTDRGFTLIRSRIGPPLLS